MSELKLQNGENIEIFDSLFLVTLNSSHDFLSVIFGILGKFRIDIGEKIFSKKKLSRWKKSWKKVEKKIWIFCGKIKHFSSKMMTKFQYFLRFVVSTQTCIFFGPEKIILWFFYFYENLRKNYTFAENPKSGRISSKSS